MNLALAFVSRLVTAINNLDNKLKNQIGNVESLNGKTLVEAIQNANASNINDEQTTQNGTWSSSKINLEIDQRIVALINGASEEGNTFAELENRILALKQAETGLISASQAQNFSPEQQAQALSNLGINQDVLSEIERTLNSGL